MTDAKAEIAGEKAALRKILQARRAGAAADALVAHVAGAALASLFPETLIPPPGAVVAAYIPFRSEISPLDILGATEARGCITALPRTPPKGAGLPLSFHVIPPGTVLQKSAFGVLESPADAPVIEPDLVLVPLLGFDRLGYRLGYGQGHYDRTLMALRARRPITAVGLAWACQEVDRIPADAFDQRLDWVVTENEAIGPLR
ncbi:MAG: 5-formyltetrahydrofolate cyclo-ligase [Hyphomonadaceae bacterium]|nr:5-formyltetrahydrofolate cyclo-ligase [Hyphomonadaceae bacterium]